MKAITFKTLAFLALAANVVLFSCKKKDDTPTPTNTGSNNTTDTTIIYKKDTMWSPAGDNGSRTFLNGTDGLVYTANQVSQNKIAASILMGYNYNTNPTYAASITDVSAFAVNYTWSDTTLTTSFKTVTLDSVSFSNLGFTSVANLYKNSSVTASPTVYNVQVGQVIAFMGASGQYGALRVIKIVTDETGGVVSPYSTYLVYSLLLQE